MSGDRFRFDQLTIHFYDGDCQYGVAHLSMVFALFQRRRCDCGVFRSEMEITMKSNKLALCALALSTSVGFGLVFAESFSDGPNRAEGKTRAEVNAELAQARASGQLFTGDVMPERSVWRGAETGAQGAAGSRYSGKTREEVKAELAEAISAGFKINSCDVGYPDNAGNSFVSTRTRQDVTHEAIEFFKAHPEARINY